MDRSRPVLALAALALAASSAATDRAADVVVSRTPVPSAWFRVGEVRIVRRGALDVVQTVLRTTHLERVVSRIVDKDRANWPTGSPGRPDSDRYVEALRRAAAAAVHDADAPGTLLIEFVRGPEVARVAFGRPSVSRDGDGLKVGEVRPIESVPMSAEYVERDMILIVADSFDESEADAARRLALRVTASRDRH